MNDCKLTKEQRDCLLTFDFSFRISGNLADLSENEIIEIAKAIYNDGFEFTNDEPTEKCRICEEILDKIQDNILPDIYDLIL